VIKRKLNGCRGHKNALDTRVQSRKRFKSGEIDDEEDGQDVVVRG
jgi:hypothetical protein